MDTIKLACKLTIDQYVTLRDIHKEGDISDKEVNEVANDKNHPLTQLKNKKYIVKSKVGQPHYYIPSQYQSMISHARIRLGVHNI